jgi:hypothetical protein
MTPFQKYSASGAGGQCVRDHWMRFDSLPDDIQEVILSLLITSFGDGLEPIAARVKLAKLKDMTDEEIVQVFENNDQQT